MVRKRSVMAGMTDYTGVPFGDILAHLRDWRDLTAQTIKNLQDLRAKVEQHAERLDYPDDIHDYLGYFVDLFSRYLGDFERLVKELPEGVTDSHIELVTQLYESSEHEQRVCIEFSRDHINRGIKDERLRYLVDDIYRESRGLLVDYGDLSNLVSRLRTFVGTVPKSPSLLQNSDILELKPNVFGLGLNLNHLIKRLACWWRDKKKGPGT